MRPVTPAPTSAPILSTAATPTATTTTLTGPPEQESISTRMEHVISRIHREHEFINYRLSWLLTSQSVLFVVYGLLVSFPSAKQPRTVPAVAYGLLARSSSDKQSLVIPGNDANPLLGYIAVVAIFICVLSYSAILAALYATGFWKEQYKVFEGEDNPKHSHSLVGPSESHYLALIAQR